MLIRQSGESVTFLVAFLCPNLCLNDQITLQVSCLMEGQLELNKMIESKKVCGPSSKVCNNVCEYCTIVL